MERQRPQQAQDDEMEVESTTSAARPQQEIIARPSTRYVYFSRSCNAVHR